MNRREFTRKVAIVGLSAPVVFRPISAVASNKSINNDNNEEGGSDTIATHGRIRLRVGNRTVIPIELRIVGGPSVVKRINLKRKYDQTNENRIFIPGISKPTIRQSFSGARLSGQVMIEGKIIYVVPTPIDTFDFDGAIVVNNGFSWTIGGLKNTEYETVDRVPALGDIPVIGSLFRHRNSKAKTNLLITIKPTLIRGV